MNILLTGYPKDTRPDMFSSSILSEIPSVYFTIMKLEELSCDKKNAEDDEGVDEHIDKQQIDEPVQVQDAIETKNGNGEQEAIASKEVKKTPDPYEFVDMEQQEVQGTPQDQVMTSQDFPEVLEETPQNKIVGRLRASLTMRKSENKKLKRAAARSLKLPSQEKETPVSDVVVEKEVAKVRTPPPPGSPVQNHQSDEELFQKSPVPPPPPVPVSMRSPVEIPILTPYGNTSAANNKQKLTNDTPLKKGDDDLRKPRPSRSRRVSNRLRSPGEEDPPSLTPYKKAVDTNDEDDDFKSSSKKRTTRSRKSSVSSTDSRKSAKGRGKAQSKESVKPSKASSLLAKGKSPEYNPKVMVEDIYKRSFSSSSSDRKRRLSSTSVASSISNSNVSLTTPVSKEKRNPKGETQLHVACRAGQLEKVQAIVETGADVNAKDNAGWTPIHEVINGKGAVENKANILRIICEKGGDVNAFGGSNEETPLHFAVQVGSESLVEILLEFGASPNIRCKNGQLPKDLAYNDVILKLLEEKSGISATSPNVSNNLNSSTLSEDHALMQTMLKKAVVFFNYDVSEDVEEATKKKLNLKVSQKLG